MAKLPDHTPALPVKMTTTRTGNRNHGVSAINHKMIVALEGQGVKRALELFFSTGQEIGLSAPLIQVVVQCCSPVHLPPSWRPMTKKPKAKKRGIVEKVIRPPYPSMPEKAQIAVEDADHLYREIRIDNTLETEDGQKVKLKEQAPVDVVIEADEEATVPKTTRE